MHIPPRTDVTVAHDVLLNLGPLTSLLSISDLCQSVFALLFEHVSFVLLQNTCVMLVD